MPMKALIDPGEKIVIYSSKENHDICNKVILNSGLSPLY